MQNSTDPIAGSARIDPLGLAWLLDSWRVIAIDDGSARVATGSDHHTTFYRIGEEP